MRRTENTDALKEAIKATGATLTRKGRSRNWLLQADSNQVRKITALVYESDETSWLWLVKKINAERPELNRDELRVIAKRNPTMTINQLVSLTGCTLFDARIVLDELEWE